MVDIEFAEDLDDIISYLGQDAILKDFGIDRAYISFKEVNFIISKFFDNKVNCSYFTCDVVRDGFYIENPNVRKLYDGKRFSKPSLTMFIKGFSSKIFNIRKTLGLDGGIDWEKFFDEFNKKDFVVKGINYSYWSEIFDNGRNYEKNIEEIEILYISNGDENYRLEFFTTHGMCPSGYTTASWGNLDIEKIDELPDTFQLVPKDDDYKFTLISNEDKNYNSLVFGVTSKKRDLSLSPFAFYDGDGGDGWYPSGYAYTNYGKEELIGYFNKKLNFPEIDEIIEVSL